MTPMVKLTIIIDNYSIEDLKDIYRIYFEYPKTRKVAKKSLENWIGNFAKADIDSIEATGL